MLPGSRHEPMEGFADRAVLEARRDHLLQLLCNREVLVAVYPRFLALSLAFRPRDISPLGNLRFATSIAASLALLEQSNPRQMLLLSEHLADGAGLELIAAVKQRSADHRCVLVLTHNHRVLVRAALEAGADAVVLEDSLGRTGALVMAVEAVLREQAFVDPALTGDAGDRDAAAEPDLTLREVAVLQLVADGLSNREIGERLHIATSTARDHVQDILRRLGARSRAAAAVEGVRRGYCH